MILYIHITHIMSFSKGNNASTYALGLPDYAADLSVQILDRGRIALKNEVKSLPIIMIIYRLLPTCLMNYKNLSYNLNSEIFNITNT